MRVQTCWFMWIFVPIDHLGLLGQPQSLFPWFFVFKKRLGFWWLRAPDKQFPPLDMNVHLLRLRLFQCRHASRGSITAITSLTRSASSHNFPSSPGCGHTYWRDAVNVQFESLFVGEVAVALSFWKQSVPPTRAVLFALTSLFFNRPPWLHLETQPRCLVPELVRV